MDEEPGLNIERRIRSRLPPPPDEPDIELPERPTPQPAPTT
jgi:hypothetical protein